MRRFDLLTAVLLVVLWSSGFIGAELGTRTASGHSVLAWRYLAAALILGVVVLVRGLRTTRGGMVRQVGLGLLMQCLYLGGIYTGVEYGVSAGLSALIAALQPLVVAVVAASMLGEHTDRRRAIGLVLGIVGVAIAVAGNLGASAPWWAYVLTVGGMISLSLGTVVQSRTPDSEPLVLALFVQCATAAAFFMAWSAVAGDVAPPATGEFWFAVAWTVVLSTFGAVGMYLLVIRRRGATEASALLYLTPPVTMIWAWVMFGDEVGVAVLVGLAVCAVGVTLVLRGRRPEAADRSDGDVELSERDEVVR